MLTVVVCEKDGSTIIDAPGDLLSVSGLEELDGQGGGSFTISRSNPSLTAHPTLLARRNVVKIYDRGVAVAAFVIRKVADVVVGSGAEADEAVTVSGPGLLSWLEDAVVYQQHMTAYARDRRWFNWGSQEGSWYNASEWGAPTVARIRGGADLADESNPWRNRPINWPSCQPLSAWIWDRDDSVASPVGDVYFRHTFTTATAGTPYRLFFTVDNLCSVEIDGAPIAALEDQWSWLQTYVVDFNLDAGSHVLAFRGRNLHGQAGLIAVLFSNIDDVLAQVATTGTGDWKCNAYPTTEPGWTFGEILDVLLTEADTRGVASLVDTTLGFDHDVDSDGDAWPTQPVMVNVGSSYWRCAEEFKALGLDLAYVPETLTLEAWISRGQVRTSVVIDAGAHAVGIAEDTEIVGGNTLLVSTGEQWGGATNAAGIAADGRVESYLDLSDMTAEGAAAVAQATLDRLAIPTESVSVSWEPVAGNRPWADFGVGDTITVSSVAGYTQRRVVSIACGMDEVGATSYSVELDAISRSEIERLQRIIDRVTNSKVSAPQTATDQTRYQDSDFAPSGGYEAADWPGGGDTAWDADAGLGDGWFDWVDPVVNVTPDPWLPPDDPSGGTSGGFSVGQVARYVAAAMSGSYSDQGNMELALLTGEPTLTSGEWAEDLSSKEFTTGTAPGYARGTLAAAAIAAASGNNPVTRLSEAAVTFGSNTGAAAWPPATHVAVIGSDDAIISVVPLSTPITVGTASAATIAVGDLKFEVGSA